MTTRTKVKIGISIVIVGLLITFLLLNSQMIEINLIVGTVETSRAVLVIAVFGLGLILGGLTRSLFQIRKSKEKPKESPRNP